MLKIKEKGITLIALVITIILLLILAGISISALTNTGIFQKAKDAKVKNEKAQAQEEVTTALNYLIIENETSTSTLTQEEKRKILEDELKKSAKDSTVIINENGYKVNHRKYDFYIDENLKLIEDEKEFDTTEWDKTAAPEDLFIWKSDDPNSSEYGIIEGYKENIDNYTVLRYPSRCTKIEIDENNYTFYKEYSENKVYLGSRDITANIKKIELPETIVEIGRMAFGASGYDFSGLERIELPGSVTQIRSAAFYYLSDIKYIYVPNSVINIENDAFFLCGNEATILYIDKLKDTFDKSILGSSPFAGKIQWKEPMTATEKEEWDKTATPEEDFIWESDDPQNESYGTIVGYNKGVDNYTALRYPSRCNKIAGEKEYRGDATRAYTKNIKKIEIPLTVSEIKDEAFSNYFFDSLEDITFPESVMYIGTNIVYNMKNLKSITISSARKIDKNAFSGCSTLKSININIDRCKTENSPWGAENATVKFKEYMSEKEKKEWDKNAAPEDAFIWGSNDPNNSNYGTIKFRREQIQNYTVLRFPSRCIKIESLGYISEEGSDRSFLKNIVKVELPKTVIEINDGAFANDFGGGYENLKEINIPENTKKIGNKAFKDCVNLKININQNFNATIIGAPWGASNSEVKWKSKN